VGGDLVQISDYPWQVALIAGYAQMRLQFCGGTLIRRDIVVTAAHCVDNNRVSQNPSRVDIVSGTSLYAEGGERKKVIAILMHPSWNPKNMDNDAAILLLDSEVEQGEPVELERNVISIGTKPTVTGWGSLLEGGRSSEELMGVAIPVIDNSVCNAAESYQKSITDNMLCAGEREGGKDSCQGNSGGPLVLGTKNEARLVGIVSWGEGCARKYKYGVYTRVSSVYDWIYSTVAAVRPEKISTTSGAGH
jgi:secreted trypsin-like serine protease